MILFKRTYIIPLVLVLNSVLYIADSARIMFTSNSYVMLTLFFAGWAFFLYGVYLLILTEKSRARSLFFIILIVFSLLSDIHVCIFKEPVTFDTVLTLMSEMSFVRDAFLLYWRYCVISVCVHVSVIVLFFYKRTCIKYRYHKGFLPAVFLLPVGLLYPLAELSPSGMPPVYQIPVESVRFAVEMLYQHADMNGGKKIDHTNKPFADNIVLIVDESIRGDYIDLNIARNTTPYLASQRTKIVNFGIASSSFNNSSSSNAVIRFGISREDIASGRSRSFFRNHTVWEYAKKAGYTTVYIDAQKMDGLQNFMTPAEAEAIDSFVTIWKINEKGEAYNDIRAAEIIRNKIKQPGKHFIMLNKKGAHFNYARCFPPSETIFKPSMVYEEPITDRYTLINTYKNAVRWSVDHFFKVLLDKNNLKNTVILYTSDHGQNLLDDGVPVTHCRNKTAIPEEAGVPLFFVTENERVLQAFRKARNTYYNKSSHFEIQPLVLTLMGYAPSIFANTGEIGIRFFYTGTIRFGKPRAHDFLITTFSKGHE